MIRTTLACLLVLGASAAFAQDPVGCSADPESLFTSKDKKLHTNKQATLHIMRDLLEAGHWSEAGKWLTDKYTQHNPNAGNGLAAVQKFFAGRPEKPIPGPKNWTTCIVAVTAEDDRVVVAIRRELDNPRQPGTKYTTTWFDMWRFVDGKADEHWDYGTLTAPPPGGAQKK